MMKHRMEMLEECKICPRDCGGNRRCGEIGYCKVDANLKIGRIAPHYWEEPCISGEKGSGAIFFAGCNMGCVFCQNEELSRGKVGKTYSTEEVAKRCILLQEQGCHNINFVTPTHYVPQIVEILKLAKSMGLTIPVVYNTSSYEKVESLQMLRGLVDIYLPDFKYFRSESAARYSKAPDYVAVAKRAIKEMVAQVGSPMFDQEGMMKRGVIVRHLVMPGYVEESKDIISYLYHEFGDEIYISIMNQFTPFAKVEDYPEINRKLTKEEYEDVIDAAVKLGVEQGFIQEGDTADESFIPSFES